jgi:KDO2-lipid IV(A) lauroyltransferase
MSFIGQMVDHFTAVVLRDLLQYRKNVVRANLSASLDYSTGRSLQVDLNGYYHYLARVIREILLNPDKKTMAERIRFIPLPEVNQWLEEGKSVIALSAHIDNWEWTGMYLGLQYQGQICALYKKIKSDTVNKWMLNRRRKFIPDLIEISKTGELIRSIQKKASVILMIADQNPGSDNGIQWVRFFDRETAFINGPEVLALKYKLPVVFLNSKPLTNGGYEINFSMIYDGKEFVVPGEITQRYASLLERNIKEDPSRWLWSHKRWKRKRN